MVEAIFVGEPSIEVSLRRNARARRMVLRVSQTSGTPILTLPRTVPLARARAFVVEQEPWLRGQLASCPSRVRVGPGLRLPFRDGEVTLICQPSGRTTLRDDVLSVVGSEAALPLRAAAVLREAARRRCLTAAEHYARLLDRDFGRITMRDPRGRWGSCSAAGNLMFSWRLIMAPDAVLRYVAAHEVAHLVEMNHSSRFWDVVARVYVDYAEPRAWLRQHGPALMRFDFSFGR